MEMHQRKVAEDNGNVMEEAKRTWKTKFCTAAESFHYAPVLVANELEMHM